MTNAFVVIAATLVLAGMLPSAAAQDTAPAVCRSMIGVDDPEGDLHHAGAWVAGPAPDAIYAAPVDLTRVELEQVEDSFTLSATMVSPPPRGDMAETYRYWIGMLVDVGRGEPDYVGIRLMQTTTYHQAEFVGPNRLDNPLWGTYEAIWSGSTVTFRMPLKILRDGFEASDLTLGSPSAAADGPMRYLVGAPWLQDGVGETAFFTPLPSCEPEAVRASVPEETNAVPLAPLVALVAFVAAAVRRRR